MVLAAADKWSIGIVVIVVVAVVVAAEAAAVVAAFAWALPS